MRVRLLQDRIANLERRLLNEQPDAVSTDGLDAEREMHKKLLQIAAEQAQTKTDLEEANRTVTEVKVSLAALLSYHYALPMVCDISFQLLPV